MPPSPRPARPRRAGRQQSPASQETRRQGPAVDPAPQRRTADAGASGGVLSFLPFRQSSRRPLPFRRGPEQRRQPSQPPNPFLAAEGADFAGADATPVRSTSPSTGRFQTLALFGTDGELISLSNERQELLCSVIGLLVKLGLVAVTGVSLIRLAGAYQQRMERQGEISAVLELQNARMAKARERFDALFMVEGEQRLIREQSQWIAPDRMRIVWQPQGKPFPTVETAAAEAGKGPARP